MAVRAFFLPMLSRIAGILLRTHLRERFDESSDVPDRRLFMCAPERRHAAHLAAVVDDPVYLLQAPALSRMGDRGRLGPNGLGPSGAPGADASVAVSTHRRVFPGPRPAPRRGDTGRRR